MRATACWPIRAGLPTRCGHFSMKSSSPSRGGPQVVTQVVTSPGLGDICVVALLAIVLLVRPQGITGKVATS